MSRVGRQQQQRESFPICQQDNCKRRLKVASTCHVSLLSPPQWQSHVQSPNPLWTFATFQLWVAPPSPPALRSNYCLCFATVFAFTLPPLSLRFLRFFWQRKMLNTIFAVDLRFSTFSVYFGAHLLLLLLLHLLVFLCFLSLGRSPHSISPVMAAFAAFFYASLCNLMSTFSWAFSLARRFVCDSQMRLQLSVECPRHSVESVCCDIFGKLGSLAV